VFETRNGNTIKVVDNIKAVHISISWYWKASIISDPTSKTYTMIPNTPNRNWYHRNGTGYTFLSKLSVTTQHFLLNPGLSVSRNRNVDSFYIINYFYSISVSCFKHNYRLFWLLFWQQSKNCIKKKRLWKYVKSLLYSYYVYVSYDAGTNSKVL
jgi:hypothetical protein